MTYKERRERYHKLMDIEAQVKKYDKRSKFITLLRTYFSTYFNHFAVVVGSLDNKVVKEMIEWVKTFCPYYELQEVEGTQYHVYRNLENEAMGEDDEVIEFSIIVK